MLRIIIPCAGDLSSSLSTLDTILLKFVPHTSRLMISFLFQKTSWLACHDQADNWYVKSVGFSHIERPFFKHYLLYARTLIIIYESPHSTLASTSPQKPGANISFHHLSVCFAYSTFLSLLCTKGNRPQASLFLWHLQKAEGSFSKMKCWMLVGQVEAVSLSSKSPLTLSRL